MNRYEKWPKGWAEQPFEETKVRNLDVLHLTVYQLANNMKNRSDEWNVTWDPNADSITCVKK